MDSRDILEAVVLVVDVVEPIKLRIHMNTMMHQEQTT
jgi:hypothetical protein